MNVLSSIGMIVVILILLGIARLVQQWLYGQSLRIILTDEDNVAVGIAVAGYLFGVIWTITVLAGAPGRGLGWWWDSLDMLLYGGLSLLLLTIAALGSCRLFLGQSVRYALKEQHNLAAAIVVAGVYVATSLTYSGVVSGEGGGIGILLLFFVLGQVALLVLAYLFRLLTDYNDAQEILQGNLAAALALAGLLIAIGIVVSWAVAGDYTGLGSSLGGFGIGLLDIIAFYLVRQGVVECIILGGPLRWRGSLLDREIAQDKNVAAGLLEATAYIATALFVTYFF